MGCQPILGSDPPPGRSPLRRRRDVGVDLAGDVALEHPDDLFLGAAFFAAPFDVDEGAGVGAHAGDHDVPQRGVGLAVPPGLSR